VERGEAKVQRVGFDLLNTELDHRNYLCDMLVDNVRHSINYPTAVRFFYKLTAGLSLVCKRQYTSRGITVFLGPRWASLFIGPRLYKDLTFPHNEVGILICQIRCVYSYCGYMLADVKRERERARSDAPRGPSRPSTLSISLSQSRFWMQRRRESTQSRMSLPGRVNNGDQRVLLRTAGSRPGRA